MYSVIQTSADQGMQTLDQHLQELVRNRIVSIDVARSAAVDKKKFLTAPTAAVAGGGVGRRR